MITQSRGGSSLAIAPSAGLGRALCLLGATLALVTWFGFVNGGTASAATSACTTNDQQAKVCVTVSDNPDPVAYSSFDGNQTFLAYRAVVTNTSKSSSVSHVGLTEDLPAETSFVRATTSRGTCSGSGDLVSCAIGSLKKGQGATVDVVVTAPASSESNPPPMVITNVVTVAFDERFNDQPNGGKQDSVTASENTTVSKDAGQTYIPQGSSGQVDTDPAQAQYGNVKVTNASVDVLASLNLLAADNFCLLGQVTIQGNAYVCRNGGWLSATLVNAVTGAPYVNAQNPLVFHLRWDRPLVSILQTADNFVVFYRTGASGPVQVIQTRCNATASNLPCLRNVQQEADGGWSVDLVKAENGHMR
jgi:hypothetical protein